MDLESLLYRGLAKAVLSLGLVLFAGATAAQEGAGTTQPTPSAAPAVPAPILTIDPDRLFTQSLYGKALLAQVQSDTETLAAENRSIEADLTAEETDLAARRPTLAPETFRAEAEAFDTKVQDIRQAQDAKESALQDQLNVGRDAFFQAARPVLGELMLSLGAGLIVDRRSVFLSVGSLDITDEALAAIDAALGVDLAGTVPDVSPDTSGD